jgi:hypothetical protein
VGRYVIQLSPTTNPNAACDDAHIIVVPPDDYVIEVPPDDYVIEVPPPGLDDYAVVLPGGGRLWVSLPPSVRAVLPHGAPNGLLTAAQAATSLHDTTAVRKVAAERGTAAQAAAILGLKPRKLQAMSQRGEIPGAAKLGRQWTYDLAKLRGFVEQQEQATCRNEKPRPDAIGAAKFSGAKLRSKVSASGGRLGQMIRQSQKRAAKQAKSGR